MKKYLLIAVAVLVATSANAQLKRGMVQPTQVKAERIAEKPHAQMKEAQMRMPGMPAKAPKKGPGGLAYYYRPAGAFGGSMVVDEEGAYTGGYKMPFYFFKPYTAYTYTGVSEGASDAAKYSWDYENYDTEADEYVVSTVEGKDLVWRPIWGEFVESPTFKVDDTNAYEEYFMLSHDISGSDGNVIINNTYHTYMLGLCDYTELEGYGMDAEDFLKSSTHMPRGGYNGDQYYTFTYYHGAEPALGNDNGWWFGKNAGRSGGGAKIDGIGQVFEAPTAPYLLKNVYLYTAVLEVPRGKSVDMTCKVYKLDSTLAFNDTASVVYPEEPGELIASGRATVTPQTNELMGGLVKFTLYGEEDGLEYEVTPTIDSPIMVVIDGYNSPEQANLKDMTAMVYADDQVDNGYGEQAFLKYGYLDSEGNVEGYEWLGLNNFFSSGSMKTGLTIFITTDQPFLTYAYNIEDGEYTFPNEGGVMEKVLYDDGTDQIVTRSIEFLSYVPSVDEGWTLTCNGEDVPEWLTIELTDEEEEGEFSNYVNAVVTAEALPEGVNYREAVVRFEFPGAYLDYKFMQGDATPQPVTLELNPVWSVNDLSFLATNDSRQGFGMNGKFYVNDKAQQKIIEIGKNGPTGKTFEGGMNCGLTRDEAGNLVVSTAAFPGAWRTDTVTLKVINPTTGEVKAYTIPESIALEGRCDMLGFAKGNLLEDGELYLVGANNTGVSRLAFAGGEIDEDNSYLAPVDGVSPTSSTVLNYYKDVNGEDAVLYVTRNAAPVKLLADGEGFAGEALTLPNKGACNGAFPFIYEGKEFIAYPTLDNYLDGFAIAEVGAEVPSATIAALAAANANGFQCDWLNAEVDETGVTIYQYYPGGHFSVYRIGEPLPEEGVTGDVNGDGEVNIADVNAVIDLILSGEYTEAGDVNGDGEINIADVNAVIDIILG